MAECNNNKVCKICGVSKPLTMYTKKERGILGVRAECNPCRSEYRRKRYTEDDEYRKSVLLSQKIHNAANPEYNRAKAKQWRIDNPDRVYEIQKRHRLSDPARMDGYRKKWINQNKHMVVAATARRQAAKMRAAPKWKNSFFISEIYHLARVRTEATGFEWHVDHIVPLRSKIVCGLHVEHNLQVIPARHNRDKGNRWWPDMP